MMPRYLYGALCGAIGATIGVGLTVGPPTAGDQPRAAYAAQHASDCEREGGSPETAAALDSQSQLYSSTVCAGYQQGRFDEMVSNAKRAWRDK